MSMLVISGTLSALLFNSCSSTMDVASKKYGNRNFVSANMQEQNTSNRKKTTVSELQNTSINTISANTRNEVKANDTNTNLSISTENPTVASVEKTTTTDYKINKNLNVNRTSVASAKSNPTQIKEVKKTSNVKSVSSPSLASKVLGNPGLMVLALFLPMIAIGLATKWDMKKVGIGFLLFCLGLIPGIIYAMIVISKS